MKIPYRIPLSKNSADRKQTTQRGQRTIWIEKSRGLITFHCYQSTQLLLNGTVTNIWATVYSLLAPLSAMVDIPLAPHRQLLSANTCKGKRIRLGRVSVLAAKLYQVFKVLRMHQVVNVSYRPKSLLVVQLLSTSHNHCAGKCPYRSRSPLTLLHPKRLHQ